MGSWSWSSPGDRIHFLDWGGPAATGRAAGVLAIHGLSQTGLDLGPGRAPSRGTGGLATVVSMDLRGHGLSDAPTDDGAYDLPSSPRTSWRSPRAPGCSTRTARPARASCSSGMGSGRSWPRPRRSSSARAARALSSSTAAGSRSEASTGVDVDEFLRGIDEPPEVMRSLTAFLRRPLAVRSGDLGRGPGPGRAGHGRGDACRSGRPGDAAARARGLRAGDVHVRPGRDAGRRRRARSRPSSPPTTRPDRARRRSARSPRRGWPPGVGRSEPCRSATTATT